MSYSLSFSWLFFTLLPLFFFLFCFSFYPSLSLSHTKNQYFSSYRINITVQISFGRYSNISLWQTPCRRLGYCCIIPENCLTYADPDHCRQAYSIQYNYSPPEIRHHCPVLLFILFYLFTHFPLSPLPWSSSPCYFVSFLFLMHDPSFHPCLQFTVSPHSTTSATSQQTYLKLAASLLVSTATSSSSAFSSWLPKAFPSRSTYSCPSAGQVPWRALVLTKEGGFFPSLGSK